MGKQKLNTLRLPLKRKYFEKIKSRKKKYEFRLRTEYWKKRIEGRSFVNIEITLGYPKRGDADRTLYRPWKGYKVMTIQHDEFGPEPVEVFAIVVN